MAEERASDLVTLAHGDGGVLGRELVAAVFRRHFRDPRLAAMPDATAVATTAVRIAITTDAFVVSPMFFAGGDIGTLAVYGTVNDLAVSGAVPEYLAAAFIIEEGTTLQTLHRISASMARAAEAAGVQVIAGDTKVVSRGQADGVYITTTGVGSVRSGLDPGPHQIRRGDVVLVSGPVGDHGASILSARYGLFGAGSEGAPVSDCRSLGALAGRLWTECPGVRMMRDLTRGGLAAAMAEIAQVSGLDIHLEETRIPIRPVTGGVARVLGIDAIDLACEGTLAAIVAPAQAKRALELARQEDSRQAALVGVVAERQPTPSTRGVPATPYQPGPRGRALLRTQAGGRIAIGAGPATPLPRIC